MNPGDLSGSPQGPTTFRVGTIRPPQKTFFYEQPKTGAILGANEAEAWSLHKKGWKQIGCSDGTVFDRAAHEAHRVYNEQMSAYKLKNPGMLVPEEFKRESLELAQAIARQGEKDEIEAARGHIVIPNNFDYMGHLDAINLIKK